MYKRQDVGSSTGGFTDCMLQNGARKVYAIDVGRGQLDWKLRQDSRVVCMEKTNIRYVTPEDIGEPVDFSSVDVSFISLTKVLEPIRNYLKEDGEIVAVSYTHLDVYKRQGQQIIVLGYIGVYERDGRYQLYACLLYTSRCV